MKIILASSSPRRIEILNIFFNNLIIKTPIVKEKIFNSYEKTVSYNSLLKANAIARKYNENIIIAADTIVYMDDILLKPKDKKDAENMLKKLSNNIHYVITGTSIVRFKDKKAFSFIEKTKVKFNEISNKDIELYLKNNEYIDKAGSYAIQGLSSVFIDSIDGEYFNVMGMPVKKLFNVLKEEFNINILYTNL